MAINTQKLLPPSSSSAIVKSGKIKINKKSKNNSNNNTINIINAIKKELEKIEENLEKIYNLVLDNNKLTEKDLEVKRLSAEKLKFTEKEKGLETKNPEKKDKESGISIPKLGIFDRINRFITFTLLGWVAVRLVKYLPKLLEFSKNLLPVMEFFSSLTANFFKGVVDFIDFGYSAYDKVKEFVKGIGGESFESAFDGFSDNLNKFINLAIIAGMATMGGTDFGSGKKGGTPPIISKPGQGGRPRVTTSGGGGAGRPDLRNPLRQRPKITGTGGGAAGRPDLRNPLRQKPKITGAGGKVLGKLGGLGGRIPIIGGLVSFIISVMSGEPVGRAAAKAVGFSIGSALGTFVPVPFVGTILGGILGDIVGGALYDTLVSNKPKKPKVVAKSKGGQVTTENQEEKLNIKNSLLQKPKVSTRGGKTVGGVAQRKVKKVFTKVTIPPKPTPPDPGKSVGGEEKLKKIFPEPPKDQSGKTSGKTIDPYGYTTGTSEKMGEIPFLGPLFNIFGKTLLGDLPNKRDYQKVGVSIGAWINTAINQGKLQGNIVSAFSNGGMIEDIGRSDISRWVEKSVEELVKNKVTEAINELKKNLELNPITTPDGGLPSGDGDNNGGGISEGGIAPGLGVNKGVSVAKKLIADLGITPAQAAGIVGNFLHESAGMNPAEVQGPPYGSPEKPPKLGTLGRGYGWAQWTNSAPGDRLDKFLKSYGGDKGKIATDNDNYKFLLSELRGSNPITGMPKDDPTEAAIWFRRVWERSGVPADSKRTKPALEVFNKIKGLSREQAKADVQKSGGKFAEESGGISGDSNFIQGNSGASKGIHFHIGPGSYQTGDIKSSRHNATARSVAFKVVKHFLGKKSLYHGRSGVFYNGKETDQQIKRLIQTEQIVHTGDGSQGGIDIQVGGAYWPGAKVKFPLKVEGMQYRTGGFGVTAKVSGVNAFVAHGAYDEKGRKAPQEIVNYYKDGGKIGKNIKSIQTEASYEENQSVIMFIQPVLQPVPVPIKGRNRTTFIGGGGSMVNRDTSGFVR